MEDRKLKLAQFFKTKELLDFVNQKRLGKEDIVALYPFEDQLILFYFD